MSNLIWEHNLKYRVIKSIRTDLKRKNINFLIWNGPSGYFFWAFQTLGIFLVKSRFFRFSRPHKCFFMDSYRKSLMRVGKIEKIDFSPKKCPCSEMPRKNIRRVENSIKSRYFGVSNRILLIWTPCIYIGKGSIS